MSIKSGTVTIVKVGFSAALVVYWLPSLMNKLATSWVCPCLFTTPLAGSALIRLVPRLCFDGYGGVRTVFVAPAAR
jgi:hypothetical protein